MKDIRVVFNPACSKCRGARDLLAERNEPATFLPYLDAPLDRATLEEIVTKLGVASPRAMMRTNEPLYRELQLETADDERLYSAMIAHPILIERPIVIRGDRAVIARPPEKLLALLDG